MSAVIRSADETRALSSRIHSLQLSNHLDDTHATLSATALQLCSVDRTRAVTLTHTYIIPDHTVNDRTWFRAMVTRTCSVQSALQHACRVLFLVHVQHVILAHSARGAQRHATRNTRRETRDRRRSSFIHPPEPPGHAADPPRPTQPTLPHKAVRGARARSSQLHLHNARRRRDCRPGRRRHP